MEKSEKYATYKATLSERFAEIRVAEATITKVQATDFYAADSVTVTSGVVSFVYICYLALKAILKVLISIESKL